MRPRNSFTEREVVTALLNLQWLIKHREATFHPESDTVIYGDGGADWQMLFDPEGSGVSEYTHPKE